MFTIISRHTAWIEDLEAVAPKASIKNIVKFTGKHLRRGLFFKKVAGWKPGTSSNRDSGTGIFL